jgi:hypothetical protein
MTFSTLASPGVSLQGGGGSGGGGGGTPGGSNTQIQYNSSGTFAGASGLTTNGTELTIASGTKTADAPVLNMSQTWNNGAVTFTGLKFNVVSDTSAAASLLMDLQVGGTSRFSVTKAGGITIPLGTSAGYGFAGGTVSLYAASNVLNIYSGALVTLVNAASSFGWSDIILTRRGAANLRFGAADAAAPVAQTLSVQSVVAGTTNTAGANLTITGSQGTGTGAGGRLELQFAPAGSSGTAQNALLRSFSFHGLSSTASYLYGPNDGASLLLGNDVALENQNTGRPIDLKAAPVCIVNSAPYLAWSTSSGNTNPDTRLYRDAANTLALRNGANAQAFNIYNTFTDASNYERGKIAWESNVLRIGTEKGGTGTARALEFQTDGVTRVTIATNGSVSLGANASVDASGNLTLLGFMSITGVAYYKSNIEIRNKANNGWVGFATRNTSGSEVVFDLTNVGSITASGDLTISTKNIVTDGTTGTKLGTATSQKIGFWNATPIVQPTTGVTAATFAANTSGITDDSATFDGYTIGQVVAALRSAGLLA